MRYKPKHLAIPEKPFHYTDCYPIVSAKRALGEFIVRKVRRAGQALGILGVVVVPAILGTTVQFSDADARPEVASIKTCQDFPENLGLPTIVNASTPEQREAFYEDYMEAEEYVSERRHIPGIHVEPEEVLCELVTDSGEEVTVISPLATVHVWELDGMEPDAGAELVPDPTPGQSYFELRPEIS